MMLVPSSRSRPMIWNRASASALESVEVGSSITSSFGVMAMALTASAICLRAMESFATFSSGFKSMP